MTDNNKSHKLLMNMIMQTSVISKIGFFLAFISISVLTACEQNPQVEQSPPISDVSTEQPILETPECGEGCEKLSPDTSFSQSSIQPESFAQLPKWNNICEKTTQTPYCSILKPYQFADGMVYLRVSGTESFVTDIHFTSPIDKDRAMKITTAALNSQQPFEKTTETADQIILYSQFFDNSYYLEETHLNLNSQNQVTQITSYSTTP
jgi:hypothetical protein